MPIISKTQATELTKVQARQIAAAEKFINKSIKEDLPDMDHTTIAIEALERASSGELSQKVLNIVVKNIRAAGWKVKHVSDQRDGNYLDIY